MNIKDYITETEKHYAIRLRTIVPIDDAAMDRIEHAVKKYKPLEITRPKKTIFQNRPHDFMNVDGAEVWIVDMIFALPASPNVLREDIRKALDAPEEFVIVRSFQDGEEIEHQRLRAVAEIEKEAAEKGLVAAPGLTTSGKYPEVDIADGSKLYGNDYNQAFLSFLGNVEKERNKITKEKTDAMFSWLGIKNHTVDSDVKEDLGTYNKDVDGAPMIRPEKSLFDIKDFKLLGDVHDADKIIKRVFLDKNGKEVVLSRKVGDM